MNPKQSALLLAACFLCIGILPANWTLAAEDPIESRFQTIDRDRNGSVTPDELPNPAMFKRLDLNADGSITLDEARRALAEPRPATKPSPVPTTTAIPSSTPVSDELKPLGTPQRDFEPVVVTGKQLPQLLGKAPGSVVAFRFADGWRQIPVQIDERTIADLGQVKGGKNPPSFKTTVYADAAMRTGADSDPLFDDDDELCFMARDAGAQASAVEPEGVVAGSRVELKIVDPLATTVRYVYLFQSTGKLQPDAGQDYVSYRFRLLSGHISGNGPNPEDSVVETSRYRNHIADRWVHNGTEILAGDATQVNVLDRDEFQFKPGICNRTTDTFSEGNSAFIANRDGPVRAIRSTVGCNSGTFAQRDILSYEGQVLVRTYLRVHPIGSTWFFCDYSDAAKGMTYYDNLNPEGVSIDGSPDEIRTDGVLHWQFVTGRQGSLTIAWKFETDIVNLKRFAYYFDDAQSDACRCTGDRRAIGASGPATGELPNTDPVLATRTPVNSLTIDRTVFYDPPQLKVDQAHARVTAAWFPLQVENCSAR